MSKIGRRGKKGAAPSNTEKKDAVGGIQNDAAWKSINDKAQSGGGFTEQDIEFMKKAI